MIFRSARFVQAAFLFAIVGAVRAQIPVPPAQQMVFPRPTPESAKAAITTKGADEMIDSFKLADGDIDSVLAALETYTGRTILRPQALVTATYSIKITRPLPKSELVLALETLLSLNGVAVIPLNDRFLKVVLLPQAKGEAPQFIEGSTLELQSSGQIATKLFQLDFLRATEAFQPGPQGGGLSAMLSQGINGGVVVLAQANAALVTDTISNLQRLETLLQSIDRPLMRGFTPKFYSLQYGAKASDVVSKLHALLQGAVLQQIGSATTFQADDRTNQVIVIADPRELEFFDNLIAKLDVKSDPNTRTVVIYLKHADAKDVQTLLQSVITGQTAASQKTGSQSVKPGEIVPAGQPAQPGMPAAVSAPAITFTAAAAGPAAPGGSSEFTSLATIIADERSNSVVVSGTVDDIALMETLVNQIDIALTQVRIEVIIAEVTLGDTDVSGITALNLGVTTNPAGATSISTFSGSLAGFDLTSGVVKPLAVNAALNATNSGAKNVVHILQALKIMTASNKEADVIVGSQLPIITGGSTSLATTGTTPVSTETTAYQNVAVELNVTPVIGDNGDVQMTIDQKVDDVTGSTTISGSAQPIIGHREAKSYVTVKDGEILVLGGLQRTQKSSVHNKIGLLYEIPILSQIFGGHTDDFERTELLFFIRPHIILPEQGTPDTIKDINAMSNRDQITEFLKDPGSAKADKPKNFIDRFKGD